MNCVSKFTFLMGFALAVAVCHASFAAGIISLDFSDNGPAEAYNGGESIGPLATNSSNWNVTTAGAGSGNASALIDDTGAATLASVTWSSDNTWGNNDSSIDDDDHSMAAGYLDDGSAVSITFSDVPYDKYRVYGLLASDTGSSDGQDWDVNGTYVYGGGSPVTAPIFGDLVGTFAATGNNWSLADGTNRGNYWTIVSTGPTLSIVGQAQTSGSGAQGSITGVIIEQIPEPATSLLAGMALVGLAWIRRRRS